MLWPWFGFGLGLGLISFDRINGPRPENKFVNMISTSPVSGASKSYGAATGCICGIKTVNGSETNASTDYDYDLFLFSAPLSWLARLRDQYMCMHPIHLIDSLNGNNSCNYNNPTGVDFKEAFSHHRVQEYIAKNIIGNDICVKYPPSRKYRIAFLKCIAQMDSQRGLGFQEDLAVLYAESFLPVVSVLDRASQCSTLNVLIPNNIRYNPLWDFF